MVDPPLLGGLGLVPQGGPTGIMVHRGDGRTDTGRRGGGTPHKKGGRARDPGGDQGTWDTGKAMTTLVEVALEGSGTL